MIRLFFLCFLTLLGVSAYEKIAGLSFEEIDQYIEKKFETVNVETAPYPYLIIHDILPDQLYQELAQNWPDMSIFDDPQGGVARKRLPLTRGCARLRNLTAQQEAIWTFLGEQIVNNCIKPRLVKKLAPFFNLKFPFLDPAILTKVTHEMELLNSRMDGLNWDLVNLQPSIHVDQSYMLGNLLIFFADDTDHPDYGTALYASKRNEQSLYVKFGASQDFDLVGVLPYLPNTLICFLQNPKGWHALGGKYEHYSRKSYMAELHIKPELYKQIYGSLADYTVEYLYQRDDSFLNPQAFNGKVKGEY